MDIQEWCSKTKKSSKWENASSVGLVYAFLIAIVVIPIVLFTCKVDAFPEPKPSAEAVSGTTTVSVDVSSETYPAKEVAPIKARPEVKTHPDVEARPDVESLLQKLRGL